MAECKLPAGGDSNRKASEAVLKWSNRFLKPDPVAFFRGQLHSVSTKRAMIGQAEAHLISLAIAESSAIARERMASRSQGDSSPFFDSFLDGLSLTDWRELSELARAFAEYNMTVVIQRSSIAVTFPDGSQCGWQLCEESGRIASICFDGLRGSESSWDPAAFSSLAHIYDTVKFEVYGFLYLVTTKYGLHLGTQS
jgi:hypothetical protein